MVTTSSEPEPLLRSTIVAAILAFGVVSPAMAGSLRAISPSVQDRDEATVPNVPDRHGCVRLCEFDLNPCDTPLEKKLDGRCTRKD